MSAIFSSSQPKQLNLVPRSSRLSVPWPAKTLHFWRHFLVKVKFLPNLVISNWLWWIKRVLLANQNRRNILTLPFVPGNVLTNLLQYFHQQEFWSKSKVLFAKKRCESNKHIYASALPWRGNMISYRKKWVKYPSCWELWRYFSF